MAFEWFSVFGIELEYMIVDIETLDVLPIADQALRLLAGEDTMEVERGPVAWSNELARHVIETKTNGPTTSLAEAVPAFACAVSEVNTLLAPLGARLLPSGMHPWMNPDREFKLWPIDEEGIYGTFDRIFDCKGHGWSNLQSMHINLPFNSDEQFSRLHTAVRFLLPILPALSASSPYIEGRRAGNVDERLQVYRSNAHRVPLVSGAVIPEAAHSQQEYQDNILQPIYAALRPVDPERVLQHEWVNARGAIARFDRMAIEIRVMDTQECPRMDLALAHLVTETLKQMCSQAHWGAQEANWPPARLAQILWQVAVTGSHAEISDRDYLQLFDYPKPTASAQELWHHLLAQLPDALPSNAGLLRDAQWIVKHGSLAERLVAALGPSPDRRELQQVYQQLAQCLSTGEPFLLV